MSDTPKRSMFGRMFGGKAETSEKPLDTELAAAEPASIEAEEKAPEKTAPFGWFQRLRQGLTKTSSRLTDGITGVFVKRKLDDETLEELEDLLIQADLGIDVASRVTNALRQSRYNSDISSEEVRDILAREVEKALAPVAEPLEIDESRKPHVILVVGVNGTGKTTTIGKYANQFAKQGLRVMLAAGDTFRAAAIEQLKIWGERTGSEVVASEPGADAASLAFDAFQRARAEGYDVLIIDTAGRLQNKSALMAELEKVIRVIRKLDRAAPHSVLLTLDATTGQNALSQVEIFDKTAGVTGLVMTKLDGTARGGILVAIASKYGIPVHAVGVGEGVEDLQSFDAGDFARAIAGMS
jgi:fused signal recognition particle receptor